MIHIKVLGPTRVEGGSHNFTATQLGGIKPRQILELLALDPGTEMAKDLLAERLWDGRPPASYVATLESYVCLLRQRLGMIAGRRGTLATCHRGYVLDPEQVNVDAVVARSLLAGDRREVEQALELVRGDLLADEPYARWANEARADFDDLVAASCTDAAREANAAREHAPAVRLARQATERACFSEPALRELMRALVGVGARAHAVRAYEEMRERVIRDLGLDLGIETRTLYVDILRDDSAGHADRAECLALVHLLRRALDANPTALASLPWSRELCQFLRGLAVP